MSAKIVVERIYKEIGFIRWIIDRSPQFNVFEMNAICEESLYNVCSCKKQYHLPLGLPLYDGHCHVDLFFKHDFKETDHTSQLASGRKLVLIDNRHQHHRSPYCCSLVKRLDCLSIFLHASKKIQPTHTLTVSSHRSWFLEHMICQRTLETTSLETFPNFQSRWEE